MKNFDISYLPVALVAEATVAGAGWSALAEFLQVVDDDFGAGSDAAFQQPVVADLRAEFDGRQVSLIVGAGDVDLVHALQLLHGNLGNQQSIVA
jgi:hypothetical protein